MICLDRSAMKLSFSVLAILLLQVVPLAGQDFVWAQQMGGRSSNRGWGTAVDGNGNVYTTGEFAGTVDFDPGASVFNLTSVGGADIFVSKLDSAGNFVWARQMGGRSRDLGFGVAVDGGGNVHTTGFFSGTADFDPGASVFNLTSVVVGRDIFVSKLDSAGNFVWARQMGGRSRDRGYGVAVDGNGNVYTTGEFAGTVDFDPGASVFNLTSKNGGADIFVSKLDSAGNFVWARQMGGASFDRGIGVAVDGSGNVYTTGFFNGTTDFDPGAGIFNLTAVGAVDIFVSKLDSAGNFVWAQRMGGGSSDVGSGVALDSSGNVYTTGFFRGIADFDPGGGRVAARSAGDEDIFVSKLDSAGNFVWARQIGGTSVDEAFGVAVDGTGNVYTTGFFSGTADFDPGGGIFNLTAAGGGNIFVSGGDIFVSKLDSAGNFVWAQQIGGASFDRGIGVAVDGSGNVYATGFFSGTADFDPGAGIFNLTSVGGTDIFVAKFKDESSAGQSPSISAGGIVLATLLPTVNTISPLSIIGVFGQNFSTDTILFPNLDSQGKLDTILGGTCLMMNGAALPIFAITPEQINAQASAAKTLGPASFTVVTNCGTAAATSSGPLTIELGRAASPTPQALTSDGEMATIEEATPGFFLFPPLANDGLIAARFTADAIAVAPDGMFTDEFGTSRPAMPGEIIVLYGTGWGETTAGLGTGELATGEAQLLPGANPMVSFGGIFLAPEDVFYVGVTPSTAGLYQLAIRVPEGAQPGNNQVVLTAYGKSTPGGPVIPVAVP